MYRRDCQYDLRGQTDMRCPECGNAFDPKDAETFLRSPNGPLRRTFERHRGRLAMLIAVVCAAYFIVPSIVFPRMRGCGEVSLALVSQENLKHIMTQWKLSIHSDQVPAQSPLSIRLAKFDERLSPYSQSDTIRKKCEYQHWLRKDVLGQAAPIVALGACLAVLLKRRMRRFFAFLTLVSTGLVVVCIFAGPIGALAYPGDTSYLSDYEYIAVPLWTFGPSIPETIVAYEKTSIVEEQRVVAFDSGRVSRLREEEFQALAAGQGIVVAGSPASE